MKSKPVKFLTFYLDNEEYGIHIERVKEIIGIIDITPVPRMPDYVKGVINLRGKIITIVNLKERFYMKFDYLNDKACVIILEIYNGNKIKPLGVIVDSVSEVIKVNESDIESTKEIDKGSNDECLKFMTKFKEKTIVILDTDKILIENKLECIQ